LSGSARTNHFDFVHIKEEVFGKELTEHKPFANQHQSSGWRGGSKVVARILKGGYNWRGADAIQMEPYLG